MEDKDDVNAELQVSEILKSIVRESRDLLLQHPIFSFVVCSMGSLLIFYAYRICAIYAY